MSVKTNSPPALPSSDDESFFLLNTGCVKSFHRRPQCSSCHLLSPFHPRIVPVFWRRFYLSTYLQGITKATSGHSRQCLLFFLQTSLICFVPIIKLTFGIFRVFVVLLLDPCPSRWAEILTIKHEKHSWKTGLNLRRWPPWAMWKIIHIWCL